MHLLIPYVQLSHPDPLFEEYTYGDIGQRARKLKSDLKKGDYVFFHTSKHGKKYVTAYYVIVCAGVLPAYVEELKNQKKVRILVYGWDLQVQQWPVP